jgi:hypothetical protein
VLALAASAADADYVAFRRNVERDIELGASPVAALGVRLDRLADQFTVEGPETVTGGRTPRKP